MTQHSTFFFFHSKSHSSRRNRSSLTAKSGAWAPRSKTTNLSLCWRCFCVRCIAFTLASISVFTVTSTVMLWCNTSHSFIKMPGCDATWHDYVPSWKRWTMPCIFCQNMFCPGTLYRNAHHLLTRSSPFSISHSHISKRNRRREKHFTKKCQAVFVCRLCAFREEEKSPCVPTGHH